MNPSNVPLPSSSRASAISSANDRPTSRTSRPPSVHTGRAASRPLGSGKWPVSQRSSSRTSTDDPPFLGTKPRVDDRPHYESGSEKNRGKSFMTFTDSSRTDGSASSPCEDPRAISPGTRRWAVSPEDGRTSKFPHEPTTLSSIDATTSQTLADITVRLEDRPSPRSRRTVDRGSEPTTGPPRRLGTSVGDRRPTGLEEYPSGRPEDLEED